MHARRKLAVSVDRVVERYRHVRVIGVGGDVPPFTTQAAELTGPGVRDHRAIARRLLVAVGPGHLQQEAPRGFSSQVFTSNTAVACVLMIIPWRGTRQPD